MIVTFIFQMKSLKQVVCFRFYDNTACPQTTLGVARERGSGEDTDSAFSHVLRIIEVPFC